MKLWVYLSEPRIWRSRSHLFVRSLKMEVTLLRRVYVLLTLSVRKRKTRKIDTLHLPTREFEDSPRLKKGAEDLAHIYFITRLPVPTERNLNASTLYFLIFDYPCQSSTFLCNYLFIQFQFLCPKVFLTDT